MSERLKVMLLMLMLALTSTVANARTDCMEIVEADSLISPYVMVNDRFYTKGVPVNINQIIDQIAFITPLKYGENGNVTMFTMKPDFIIPEDWGKYEIPREQVKCLEEIEDEKELRTKMTEITTSGKGNDSLVGKPLPGTFVLHDIEGNVWTEQSLKGHKVVVNAWFSGCGPCLKEMPILSEWKSQFPDVIFLSVNFEKTDKVKKITEARGFNWIHIYEDNYFMKFVGMGGFPLFLVIGEDGLVRYAGNGTNDGIRKKIMDVIKGL